jgi:GNAT superfamily N-acetyltransferase
LQLVGWFRAWLERLVRFALELAASLVRGILGAPFEALRRAGNPVIEQDASVSVRRATADEVRPLRLAVLRPGRPPEAAIWEGDGEPTARHYVAERGGRVIGIASVLERRFPGPGAPGGDPVPAGFASSWQLRGMASDPSARGCGVGRRVLDLVHEDVAAPMWCNARTTAAGFYRKAGWIEVGGTFDTPGIGPHVRMVWRGR